MQEKLEQPRNVFLFDDECLVCNKFIKFLIKIDSDYHLKFASLNGSFAMNNLPLDYKGAPESKTAFFLTADNKQVYRIAQQSDAILDALITTKRFTGIWRILKVLPTSIRNWAYAFASRNRYSLGKRKACELPSIEHRMRILP